MLFRRRFVSSSRRFAPATAATLVAAGLLASCGGGDVSSPPVVATTTISGSVVKGPVTGATVCAYKAISSGKGEQIKCATTTAGGAYSLDLQYAGDVVIEASGGTYSDEATSTTKTLADPLQLVLASQGGSVVGMVTPLTTVAYSISKGLSGGVSSTNFGTAASTVASQFKLAAGTNIASTPPAIGAGANSYGQALQAVSRFVANGGSLTNFLAWTSPATFQAGYGTAFAAANGVTISFDFSATTGASTTTVTGTGAGGGTASCAVTVAGSVSVAGFTQPISLKYCIRGLQTAAECSGSNTTINQSLSGQSGLAGTANLTYSYGTDCTGAVTTIDLK